jgi:hypothetical protein
MSDVTRLLLVDATRARVTRITKTPVTSDMALVRIAAQPQTKVAPPIVPTLE